MEGRNLERAVANTSHPRYAAPGEAEGEDWRGNHEWLTPAQRRRLAERADNPPRVEVGLQAAIERGGKQ